MKKSIVPIFAALAVILAGGYLGKTAATGFTVPAKLTPVQKYTLHQETRDGSGKLIATELRVYDAGRYYWRYTNANTGHQIITLLTDSGGYMNQQDESDPNRLVKVREAGALLTPPEALQAPDGWQRQAGFQRFGQYQGQVVAVEVDEVGEHWIAPELYPSPLRSVRRNGMVTETVRITIGEADAALFVGPK